MQGPETKKKDGRTSNGTNFLFFFNLSLNEREIRNHYGTLSSKKIQ